MMQIPSILLNYAHIYNNQTIGHSTSVYDLSSSQVNCTPPWTSYLDFSIGKENAKTTRQGNNDQYIIIYRHRLNGQSSISQDSNALLQFSTQLLNCMARLNEMTAQLT